MDSDLIEIWSLRIAEVATPDDVDSAPLMTKAFIKGGKDKESLFPRKKRHILGGFGSTGCTTLYPSILESIASSASLIYSILSPLTPAKSLIDILGLIKAKNMTPLQQREVESVPEYVTIVKTVRTFEEIITKSDSGISKEQCESLAYRTLITMLEDPSSSIRFVEAISKVPR